MAKTAWLAEAHKLDLSGSMGNGPFGGDRPFLGVILHVNVDESGTPDSFWRNNAASVCPNFQVYKTEAAGGIHQMLPFNWQPWCQVAGNFNYAAIETAGMPDEPLTEYQLNAIARILKVYHTDYGMVLQRANTVGMRGFGYHRMGGLPWGGHSCPGDIRIGQRLEVLRRTNALLNSPAPKPDNGGKVLHRVWPSYMPKGHYFGLISGGDASHGGFYASERPDVKAIQVRLQNIGWAPKTAGWADGIFEAETRTAVQRWQAHNHWTTDGRITHERWMELFTY